MANLITHTSGLQLNVEQLNHLRGWGIALTGFNTWSAQDQTLLELLDSQLIADNEECESIHQDSLDSE